MASDAFLKCIGEGKYETVSAGTTCTIDIAKKHNLYDPKTIVKSNLDVDTYESNDSTNSKALCVIGNSGKQAYANCALEKGQGFTRRSGYPNQCITAECPPGFIDSGRNCKKPEGELASINKKDKCDSSWHSWFTTPNYHLGNKAKFDKDQKTCYDACKDGYIPGYTTDPVDGSIMDSGEDNLSICVSKADYFGGKYTNTPDFCPISWVTRLTLNDERIDKLLQQSKKNMTKSDTYELNTNFTEAYNAASSELSSIAKKMHSDPKMVQQVEMSDEQTSIACMPLNTETRLMDAYNQCTKLQDEDNTHTFQDMYMSSYGNTQLMADQKVNMLKQSCHALFCDPNNNTSVIIDKDPICFPTSMKTTIKPIPKKDDKETPIPTTDKNKKKVMDSLSIFMLIILIPVVITLLYLICVKFIYPYIIIPLYQMITGKKVFTESENVAQLKRINQKYD